MKRTSKQKQRQDDPALKLVEKWSLEVLEKIANLENVSGELRREANGLLKRLDGARSIEVGYFHSEGSAGYGRAFALGFAAQTVSKDLRRLGLNRLYVEADLVNAHPTILWWLGEMHGHTSIHLQDYVERREEKLEEVMSLQKCDRATAKKLVLSVLYLGKVPKGCRFLRELRLEAEEIYDSLVEHSDYQWAVEQASLKPNVRSSFLSRVLNQVEFKVMERAIKVLSDSDLTVGVLIHDGLLIEHRSEDLSPVQNALLDVGVVIAAEFNGLPVSFTVERFDPTPEDVEILKGPERVIIGKKAKKPSPLQHCLERMQEFAEREGLCRYGDSVFEPHPTIVGAFRPLYSFEKFIDLVFVNDVVYGQSVVFSKLVQFLETQHTVRFPLIREFDRYFVGFLDCVVDTRTCEARFFESMGEEEKRHVPPYAIFFEISMQDAAAMELPYWERLIKTQTTHREPDGEGKFSETEEEAELFRWVEVLVGRLFLPPSFDKWQVSLFVLGPADRGKSVFVETVQSLFPCFLREEIGGSGRKSGPGILEHLKGTFFVSVPDCPADLSDVLPGTSLTQVIDGVDLSVSVFRKPNERLAITFSLLLAGNELPGYANVGDRIGRRFLVLQWSTPIRHPIYDLKSRIESELPGIFLRCLSRYHDQLRSIPQGVKVRSLIPTALLYDEMEVRRKMSPFIDFVCEGDNRVYFTKKEGSVVRLSTLSREYASHCKTHCIRAPITVDEMIQSLGQIDWRVEKKNICIGCHHLAQEKYCICEKKEETPKSHVRVVLNMVMYRTALSAEEIDKIDLRDEALEKAAGAKRLFSIRN